MQSSLKSKILKVGHSPDPDDAFMFYALTSGAVKLEGFEIEHVIEDIESLNKRAIRGELEVTAISAALYPWVARNYSILSSGASVGRKYGPIVVAKSALSEQDLRSKRIAIPGALTTAYLLLRIFLDDFIPVEINFAEIMGEVQAGSVDAGLLIHEGQLNYGEQGLTNCMDLGRLWFDKFGLPIPLGLDVVRKDLGLPAAREIQRALRESIRVARSQGPEALDYALKFGRGIPREVAKKFVGMYVNDDTEDLGEEGARALKILFSEGEKRGLFKAPQNLEIVY